MNHKRRSKSTGVDMYSDNLEISILVICDCNTRFSIDPTTRTICALVPADDDADIALSPPIIDHHKRLKI